MEKGYEFYCVNGLRDTGIKELGKYCGMTSANLYAYIFTFVRAAVHYAMFEDEYYLKMQMKAIKASVFSILRHDNGGKIS